jgi:hypothetical protein
VLRRLGVAVPSARLCGAWASMPPTVPPLLAHDSRHHPRLHPRRRCSLAKRDYCRDRPSGRRTRGYGRQSHAPLCLSSHGTLPHRHSPPRTCLSHRHVRRHPQTRRARGSPLPRRRRPGTETRLFKSQRSHLLLPHHPRHLGASWSPVHRAPPPLTGEGKTGTVLLLRETPLVVRSLRFRALHHRGMLHPLRRGRMASTPGVGVRRLGRTRRPRPATPAGGQFHGRWETRWRRLQPDRGRMGGQGIPQAQVFEVPPSLSLSLSSGMLGGHVPMDLVECCFNCFAEDHVTAHCPTEA